MVITTKEMKRRIQALFPGLVEWLPTDREYLTVELAQVVELVNRYGDTNNLYIPSLWECEEIAMAFVSDVRRGRAQAFEQLPFDARKNLAIGEALGTRWGGVDKSHHANIFFSEKEVYLLDLQLKKAWRAEKEKDDIFFVRI